MLDQRAAPYASRQIGKIDRAALGFEDQVQIFGQRAGREAGVNRSLVVRVVVAGDHHDRHLRPRDRPEREGEALLGDARRIEQVADYQQHVGVALVGDVDNAAEGGAHLVAQLMPRSPEPNVSVSRWTSEV